MAENELNMKIFTKLSYGVYVITTWDEGRATGCTANSAMQIMAEPATIAVSIHHDNYTNHCIADSGHFALSIMAEKSDPMLIGKFGFFSGKDTDKFDGVEYEVKDFLPVIKDSCGYLTCEVVDRFETQTHTIFLGKVIGGDIIHDTEPMTYAYYHKEVKGKSSKNAPTYLPDEV